MNRNNRPAGSARITAYALIALAAFSAAIHFGPFAGIIVAVALAALLTPLTAENLGQAGDVSVDAALNLTRILDVALGAYKRAIINLNVFSTVFRDVQLNGSNKVNVPYYPLNTTASRDFDNAAKDCYTFDDAYSTAMREITVNKRKYQPVAIRSQDLDRTPAINMDRVMAAAGEKLAYDVMLDVFSIITAANYGAAAFTGADTTFDSDDFADLVGVADTIPWPQVGRGVVVKPTYKANLLKDNDVKLAYAYGDDNVIKDGVLPRVMGFDFGSTPAIPSNGENLVGFMAHMSAVLVAFSPVTPAPAVMDRLMAYEVVTDPDTGISLEYRAWGDADCDEERHIIEANYGFAKGNEDGLRRFVSA